MQGKSVCGNAISGVTFEACLMKSSSCANANGTAVVLLDGDRRVVTTFTDLLENRNNYSATLNISYNGGVVQQSQPVEISQYT